MLRKNGKLHEQNCVCDRVPSSRRSSSHQSLLSLTFLHSTCSPNSAETMPRHHRSLPVAFEIDSNDEYCYFGSPWSRWFVIPQLRARVSLFRGLIFNSAFAAPVMPWRQNQPGPIELCATDNSCSFSGRRTPLGGHAFFSLSTIRCIASVNSNVLRFYWYIFSFPVNSFI